MALETGRGVCGVWPGEKQQQNHHSISQCTCYMYAYTIHVVHDMAHVVHALYYLLVLWSSCLATKVLTRKYGYEKGVGQCWKGEYQQVCCSTLSWGHSIMHLMDTNQGTCTCMYTLYVQL